MGITDCGEIEEKDWKDEEKDKDIYPVHPEDVSCTHRTDKLLEAAELIRQVGNDYFKAQDWNEALMKYQKALRYLEPLLMRQHREVELDEDDPAGWAHGSVRPRIRSDALRMKGMTQLNVMAVFLQLKLWRETIAMADGILMDFRGKGSKKNHDALPIDDICMKALFRKAKARVGLSSEPGEINSYQEALQDLRQSLNVRDTGPLADEVRSEIKRVEALERAVDSKSKKLYEAMVKEDL